VSERGIPSPYWVLYRVNLTYNTEDIGNLILDKLDPGREKRLAKIKREIEARNQQAFQFSP
jgi:hypothetical protein